MKWSILGKEKLECTLGEIIQGIGYVYNGKIEVKGVGWLFIP